MPEHQGMTTRLKTLFQRPELFVLAGGINPIGAKMAEALGYDAFYMSGGNTSAHQLGWPDSGTSMRDMVDNARKIVLTVQIPVFADADTGYGDAISTHYTVREYIQAGIAGAHIEDQTFPPKSGPRRRCISIQEMVGKLRAAMDAKTGSRPGLRDHGPVRSRRPALTTMAGLQANWDFLSDFQQRGTLALDALRAQAAQSPCGVASNGRILDEPRLRSMEEMYLPD